MADILDLTESKDLDTGDMVMNDDSSRSFDEASSPFEDFMSISTIRTGTKAPEKLFDLTRHGLPDFEPADSENTGEDFTVYNFSESIGFQNLCTAGEEPSRNDEEHSSMELDSHE